MWSRIEATFVGLCFILLVGFVIGYLIARFSEWVCEVFSVNTIHILLGFFFITGFVFLVLLCPPVSVLNLKIFSTGMDAPLYAYY